MDGGALPRAYPTPGWGRRRRSENNACHGRTKRAPISPPLVKSEKTPAGGSSFFGRTPDCTDLRRHRAVRAPVFATLALVPPRARASHPSGSRHGTTGPGPLARSRVHPDPFPAPGSHEPRHSEQSSVASARARSLAVAFLGVGRPGDGRRGRLQPAGQCPRLQPREGGPLVPSSLSRPAGSRAAQKRERKGSDGGSRHPHLKMGALADRLKPTRTRANPCPGRADCHSGQSTSARATQKRFLTPLSDPRRNDS